MKNNPIHGAEGDDVELTNEYDYIRKNAENFGFLAAMYNAAVKIVNLRRKLDDLHSKKA